MKLESMVFGTTWVLMNALLVMVAVEPLSVGGAKAPPAPGHFAAGTQAPAA